MGNYLNRVSLIVARLLLVALSQTGSQNPLDKPSQSAQKGDIQGEPVSGREHLKLLNPQPSFLNQIHALLDRWQMGPDVGFGDVKGRHALSQEEPSL